MRRKRYLASVLAVAVVLSLTACGTQNNENADSVEETESAETNESEVVSTLLPAAYFISGQAGEKFEVKTEEIKKGVTVSYVEAEAYQPEGSGYRIDLVKSEFDGVDLTSYDVSELALEFWIKSSDSRMISINSNNNILRMGRGDYFTSFVDATQYVDFKGNVLRLKAGEWTKITLPLQDAKDFDGLLARDSVTWARFLVQNLDEGVKICVSDFNIVKINEN